MKVQIGKVYREKRSNRKVKVVGKTSMFAIVSSNLTKKHITYEEYSNGNKIPYYIFKADWVLALRGVLKEL